MPTSLCGKDSIIKEWQWRLRNDLANDSLLPPHFRRDWDAMYHHPTLQADDVPFLCVPGFTYGPTMKMLRSLVAAYLEPVLDGMWKGNVVQEMGLPAYDPRWKSRGYGETERFPLRFLGDARVFAWWNLSGEPLLVATERPSGKVHVIVEAGQLFVCLINNHEPEPLSLLGSSGSRPCMEICPTFAWRVQRPARGLGRRRPLRLRLWPQARAPKGGPEEEWLEVFNEVPADHPAIDPETSSVRPYFEEAEDGVTRDPDMESWVAC